MRNGASCILCGCALRITTGLCRECEFDLPYPDNPCIRCSVELGADPPQHGYCGQCLLQPPAFDACLGLLQYEYPARELISAYKFQADFAAGRTLGDLLARSVATHLESYGKPQMLVPVPLHKRRLSERGFNQSVELARCIGRLNTIPVVATVCRRIKATPPQKGLSALERSRNLKGAFTLDATEIPANANHIAIVDDVVTTMSTVDCIARLFKTAGVDRIDVYCLARVTPT